MGPGQQVTVPLKLPSSSTPSNSIFTLWSLSYLKLNILQTQHSELLPKNLWWGVVRAEGIAVS